MGILILVLALGFVVWMTALAAHRVNRRERAWREIERAHQRGKGSWGHDVSTKGE